MCSGGVGGAGSPCINELGQAWGIAIGSYPDTVQLDESDEESEEDTRKSILNQRRVKRTNHEGKLYYDVISDHNLKPLVVKENSLNRNLVLTFGNSGVKYVMSE